jgi:hypothetical protein
METDEPRLNIAVKEEADNSAKKSVDTKNGYSVKEEAEPENESSDEEKEESETVADRLLKEAEAALSSLGVPARPSSRASHPSKSNASPAGFANFLIFSFNKKADYIRQNA